MTRNLSKHPCFNAAARRHWGRVHLPVAPGCNINCAYCQAKTDCVHESRPGVTSALLDPFEAAAFFHEIKARQPEVSVAGIAGPGDPFFAPELTLKTLEYLRASYPDLLLCVSSNGLNLVDHIEALVDLGVDFVTVTVNAMAPEILQRIVSRVRLNGRSKHGYEAAGLLLDRQLTAISRLKARKINVKVNTVVIPGVNDRHVEALASRLAPLGVDLMNLIPLIPVPGTPMAGYSNPSPTDMARLRAVAGSFIPQMQHCVRCRADAAGLLNSGTVQHSHLAASKGEWGRELEGEGLADLWPPLPR
ncbi:MAG: radical SAM protein [Deltaproteobacteria bacterium]|nr:radical SAM protein [Deltaproteobacteria bacterium]MBI4795876.1 radical SAM protein [Deltaproteobacteria bacterium]